MTGLGKKFSTKESFSGNVLIAVFGSGSSYVIGLLFTPIAINFSIIATLNLWAGYMLKMKRSLEN